MRKKGFTLVELMVVAAVIGILATLAVTNYHKFSSRARQSEAKFELSTLYTAEKSFYGEYDSYTQCLNLAGSVPVGTRRYYGYGFETTAPCDPGDNDNCGGNQNCCYPLSLSNGTCPIQYCSTIHTYSGSTYGEICFAPNDSFADYINAPLIPSPSLSGTAFKAYAGGSLIDAPLIDVWSIDQNRVLRNIASGL